MSSAPSTSFADPPASAVIASAGLLDEPVVVPHVDVPCSAIPEAIEAWLGAGAARGTIIVSPPGKGPQRGARTAKPAHRCVSPLKARLAAGLEVVAPEGNRSAWYSTAKRTLDVTGALVLLVLFSPILLTTYLVLLFTTRGKAVFRQQRVGYCGRPFTMYKFRTMRLDALRREHEVKNEQDGPIFKNRRDPRVTRVGRFLRATSIDEMPQLVNVLLGQMSLVGPRPPLKKEVARYSPWQLRRLAVKPGLTCLWQVSGRSEIGFAQWVSMDLWYVRNQSLLTDLSLLAKTPRSVLSRRGAY
jgi:lipopolysaccharide/colanic/teichoic acid biosynthesis glycosyltransferase